MSNVKRSAIEVQGTSISILSQPGGDYISLTDMVRNFDGGGALIEQWLKNKDTVLFLGVWERINNPDFNSLEFEGIRNEAGRNSFFLSARKWIELTGAKGLIAGAGRYGRYYAHRDVAFEFGSWLSPRVLSFYLIKEFQRLKDEENDRLQLGWNLQRTLAKINYRIHTDAIKETLIPPAITKQQASLVYATEADLLNVALFGHTAKQWRDAHPGSETTTQPLQQLVVLTNLESLNSVLIRQGLSQAERLRKLNEIAISQMRTLFAANNVKRLK